MSNKTQDPEVIDEAELDFTSSPTRYDITSFGADYDVDGLVKRLRRGDVFIPPFQRDYVWNQNEASRFIESLLLGLPVPGVFLAKDDSTNRLLVIDGQQRLKSLQFFYDGFFNPAEDTESSRIFKLQNVQDRFEGKTYKTLEERDRIHLDNTIIHATVIKQQSPADGDTSIYHVFERLNTGGRKLTAQEIRIAVYHGPLIEALGNINSYPDWRGIYGKESVRLKDQELILRFFALYADAPSYRKPMVDFLNRFSEKHRKADGGAISALTDKFKESISFIKQAIGAGAFRRGATLNAAVFDSIMVGLARRFDRGPIQDLADFSSRYTTLMDNPDYIAATEKATSNDSTVRSRIELATAAFSDLR